ncbi:MAG TPA: HupE/UreJ family protein [Terriglobia bacterium]|nr:HupE/UreJ family protein [Terriglobia bacterium]
MRRSISTLTLVMAAVMLFPASAHAHLVSSGMGPFYDGISHLLLSPDDLLGVVALALWAGLHGKRHGRLALAALPGAWVLGGIIGLFQPTETLAPAASALSIVALGVLLAANASFGAVVFLALAAAFGLFHGFLNGTAAAGGMGFTGLIGIALGVFTLAALLSSTSASLKAHWMKIAARVAGSWIAAFGLLMIGWAMRPKL